MNTLLEKTWLEKTELQRRLEISEDSVCVASAEDIETYSANDLQSPSNFTTSDIANCYRQLLDRMHECVVTLDDGNNIVYCNVRFAELLHIAQEQLPGTPLYNYIPETDRPLFDTLCRQTQCGNSQGSINLCSSDGRTIRVSLTCAPLPPSIGATLSLVISGLAPITATEQVRSKQERAFPRQIAINSNEDISHAIETRQANEQQLRIFIRSAPAAIAMFDRQMHLLAASRRFIDDFHIDEVNVAGRTHNLIFPDFPQRWRETCRRCLRGEKMRIDEDHLLQADGSTQWLRWEITPWYTQKCKVGGLILFAENITERKQIEQDLATNRQLLAGIIDSAMDAIISIDSEHRIVLFNHAAERMFRCSSEEAVGTPLERFIPEPLRHEHREYVRDFAQTGATNRTVGKLGSVTGFRNDGEEFPIEASISQISINGERLFTAILRDVSERRRTDTAMREWLELQKQIAHIAVTVPGVIYSLQLRANGTFCMPYVSPTFENIYGLNTKAVTEDCQEIFARIHPDDIAHFNVSIALSAETMEPWHTAFRYRHETKGEVWIEGHAMPQREPDGSVLWHGYMQDITGRKQAEEALRKQHAILQTILDNTTDIIFMKDCEGRYMVINAAGAEMAHKDADEILGRNAFAVFPADVAAEMMEKDRQLIAAKASASSEETIILAGRKRHFSTAKSVCCDPNGNVIGLVGIARDVTERREMIAALIDADRRKDEFLAMLAHELRNPLAPIRNAVLLLSVQDLDKQRLTWVRKILERNIAHMVRLVDDLLDVSRITRGKVTLQNECVALATIIERAVETTHPLLDIKRHNLQVRLPSQPVYLQGDPVRLAQIIANLLNNSAKYTAENGHIELKAEVAGMNVLIRVRDNGMGIRSELLPQVFDLFRQDERNLDRSQGGLGIGLTLVKRLVELHGGEVTAHSAGVDQGAEFNVRLPRLTVSNERPEQQDDAIGGAKPLGLRVLVIDDNQDVAESIAILLQIFGHQVEIAADAPQGLNIAQRFKPDVVLLDIGLPGMDGYELAKQLRMLFPGREVLLIALSGYGRSEDIARASAAGIDHYLVKPADPTRLRELIAGYQTARDADRRHS